MRNVNSLMIKKTLMYVLIITVLIISYNGKYVSLIHQFEGTASSKEALINQYIELSDNFIDFMTMYGNTYFQQGPKEDSELFNYLQSNPANNTYNLDAVGRTKYQDKAGNLSGAGSIPESGINREEMNLAFQYNQFFYDFYKRLPDLAWVSYVSRNSFVNMYPWVASDQFAFSEDLKNSGFYKNVTPQNDPLRIPSWSPVYMDSIGKGLAVTLSSPVYDRDMFKGVVSLNFSNVRLSELIDSEYESYLVDSTDSVIATSHKKTVGPAVTSLSALLRYSQLDVEQIKKLTKGKAQRVGLYYVYSVDFDRAPWRMFFIVPVALIVIQSAFFTLPILFMCILFYLTFLQVEKRKRTEGLLRNSLMEIKSYQNLLENAALYDFLTNTYNRRGLNESFLKIIAMNESTRTPISFLMGDIDHFKQFNDTFGHAAGDKVLIEISRLIKESIDENDVVCRWGGEEFLIMLVGRTYDEALKIAEIIRKKIEDEVIPWENGEGLKVSMTFGAAEHNHEEDIKLSINKADTALYMGKEKGRNQVVGYGEIEEVDTKCLMIDTKYYEDKL